MSSTDCENYVVYNISEGVHYESGKMHSFLFAKKGLVLDAEKPLTDQIRFMFFDNSLTLEDLHLNVKAFEAPFFKAFVKETGRVER